MRQRLWALSMLIILLASAAFALPAAVPAAFAQAETPPAEEELNREVTLTIDYTAYEWWLVRWRDNEPVCYFWVDHEGLPTEDDIRSYCGDVLAGQWRSTRPCLTEPGQCAGLYLHPLGTHPDQREVTVELPLPSVWVTLEGCSNETPRNTCASLPTLVLTGEEPLPNEAIITIQGVIDGRPFSCSGDTCRLPLQPTGTRGVSVQFWAESTFGDASEVYTALVRVRPQGSFMDPDARSDEPQLWYADVLSSQWRGAPAASCADTWGAFPPIGGPEPWLTTPDRPEDLFSDLELYYLAGILIRNGTVDASSCPAGGLTADGVANECGLEVAEPAVLEWQNRFDTEIWQVARDTGVPAQLMKNVFSRESQLWPGIYADDHAGLGQLTEQGTDAMLLWNRSFYDQFCPLVLHQASCDLGYGNLDPSLQEMLRGALFRKVDASCPDCPDGIDLTQAAFSVRVFAEGLQANCEQVGRILFNLTQRSPGDLASYEDLWRLTLANYNAGPGCLRDAMEEVFDRGEPLTWDSVAARLPEGCALAVPYVEDISRELSGIVPTPTSWVYPGQPPPQVTPGGVTPTATPTRSPTRGVTPAPGTTRTSAPTITPSGPTVTVAPYPGGGPTQPPAYP